MGSEPKCWKRYRNRRDDVGQAIHEGHGIGWLAKKWNVSKPAVSIYCWDHWPDDAAKLAENGRTARVAALVDMPARLELIHLCLRNGWTRARIARAMGLNPSALTMWLARNAPDGVADALADCCDDEEAA